MTLDEAQDLWSKENSFEELSDESMRSIIKESNSLDRTVLWRDIREWAATLLVCGIFTTVGLIEGTPTAWFLSAALIALIPGIYMIYSRIQGTKEQEDIVYTNFEHIESAIKKYRRQENLLNNVVLWYLAPLFASALLVIIGTSIHIPGMPWSAKLIMFSIQTGFCLLIFAGVAWLNFRASKKHLQPKRKELEAMLIGEH